MIGALTNHLWQSTLFAIAAAFLTLVFRKNQAKVRYWLWLSAVPEISAGPVIDKTGLSGMFDIDPAPPGGLNLTPARGPDKLLVIDHVERPTEN